MQQKDNDFPIDQIQSGTNPPNGGLAGGTTFQPQTNAESPASAVPPQANPAPVTTPDWQQTAASDANALYQPPATPNTPPSDPGVANPPGLATPDPAPVQPSPAMQQDFSQANQLATPGQPPQPGIGEPMPAGGLNQAPMPAPATTPQEPIVPMPEPVAAPVPMPPVAAPFEQTPQNPLLNATAPNVPPAPAPGLPGSDQLGQAANGMGQQPASYNDGLDPNMAGVDPLAASMDGMGAYGPPPNNKKKMLFIIGGAILGILIIGIIIFVITSSSARKPAQNLNPTTSTDTSTPTEPTPAPTSGPATPPQGYVTIDKQCYSFALYDPNTVPTDPACSFTDATFGKLQTSKISVLSVTQAYKNLDEFVGTVKPTLTVTSEESIKLDNFDAKQLIYKASDGKTYSRVLALIVGKSYQQDGNPVTGIDITTSYQEDFDKTVTKNVLDTWRWK